MAGFTVGRWMLLVLLVLFGLTHGDAVRAGGDLRSGGLPDDQAHARHLMNATSRIVGGRNAHKERFTYMCSLKNNNREHVCGAVLIDPNWALTAAHCVHPDSEGAVTSGALLAIGAHQRTDDDTTPGVELIGVAEIHWHDNYTPNEDVRGWDIALLKLDTPSKLTPIRLPNTQHVSLKEPGPYMTLGWGEDSETLQELHLYMKTMDECKASYKDLGPNIICALGASGDTCKGDSGGPVLIPNSKNDDISAGRPKYDALVALTSFGSRICRSFENPAGYTLVAPYKGWIKKTMNGQEQPNSTPDQINTLIPAAAAPHLLLSPPTSSPMETQLPSPSPPPLLPKEKKFDLGAVIFKVLSNGKYQCQGVLVDPQWIATAAHCVKQIKQSVEIARIGASSDEGLAGKVIIHPDFSVAGKNDVAMIRLTRKQDGILLPKPRFIASRSSVKPKLVTSMYDSRQEKLHTIGVEEMQTDQCPIGNLKSDTICAEAHHTPLCMGETSGAPLLQEQRDGTQLFIGILYWGPSCIAASSRNTLLYQSVSPVRAWMERIIALK